MRKIKRTKIEIMSFIIILMPVICFVVWLAIAISSPAKMDAEPIVIGNTKNVGISYAFIWLNFKYAMSFISFIVGIVAIFKRGSKKALPIISVIINSLILSIPISIYIKILFKIPLIKSLP